MSDLVPRPYRWLLHVVAPPDQREWLLADLDEEANALARTAGLQSARRWSRRQVLASVAPLLRRRFEAGIDTIRSTPMSIWRGLRNDIVLSLRRLRETPAFGITYPDSAADCEDYVLIKRKRLMEAGIAPSNLLITVVLQPNGEGHAVLTVRTDRGDFVLDNMRNKVLLWSQTEYRYLKRQSSVNAGKWVKLQDGRADAVGSVK